MSTVLQLGAAHLKAAQGAITSATSTDPVSMSGPSPTEVSAQANTALGASSMHGNGLDFLFSGGESVLHAFSTPLEKATQELPGKLGGKTPKVPGSATAPGPSLVSDAAKPARDVAAIGKSYFGRARRALGV
jgi:hypothetical protein